MIESKTLINQEVEKYAEASKVALRTFCSDFEKVHFDINIDYSKRRTAHRGGMYPNGRLGINMAGNLLLDAYCMMMIKPGMYIFKEYASYAANPVIGNAFIDTWQQNVMLTVGHEVSHVCQYFLKYRDRIDGVTPHGTLFKNCYRAIRSDFNLQLPNQKEADKKYKAFLASIRKREVNVY